MSTPLGKFFVSSATTSFTAATVSITFVPVRLTTSIERAFCPFILV